MNERQARELLSGWRIPDNCVSFARAMHDYDHGFDWPYFLEKPYKWAREFAAWTAAGRPIERRDPGWDGFERALDAIAAEVV